MTLPAILGVAALMISGPPDSLKTKPELRDEVALSPTTLVGLGGTEPNTEIVVWKRADGIWTQLAAKRKLNPWKLLAADVDGDGLRDIAVGVTKKSRYDPVMEKRVFFYNWDGAQLVPKWLGSRLTRRFDDFVVFDIDGDRRAELFALERCEGDRKRVSMYRWFSFGFDWISCSFESCKLTGFASRGAGVVVQGGTASYRVVVQPGHLALVEVSK